MIENTIHKHIAVSPEVAYAFFTDTRRWPEWMTGVKTVEAGGDFGPGVEILVDYTEGMQARMHITEASPPKSYAYEVDMKDMRTTGTVLLAPEKEGTSLTYRETVTPQSFMMKLMKPFIANGIRRALDRDFETARQLLEEGR